jgi:Holliday junction DNA helicase RuvB
VPFTLIAATTEGGMTPSMVDRFGVKCALQYYSASELAEIITLRADRDLFMIDPDAAHMLAVRSQGVPRIAGNRLARATDQAVKAGHLERITMAHATAAMDQEEIDALGLGTRERTVLTVICMEVGQPIGRKSIASVCGYRSVEEEMSILIRLGLVEKASGSLGSVATRAAYVLLGLAIPATCPGGKP